MDTGPDNRTRPDSQIQIQDQDTGPGYRGQDTGPDQIIRSDTTDTGLVTDTDVDITIHIGMHPGKSLNIWQNPATGTDTGIDTGLETAGECPGNGKQQGGWLNKTAFRFWGSAKICIALPITSNYLTKMV